MPCSSSSAASVAVAITGMLVDRVEVTEHRLQVEAVLVATVEVVLHRARGGDGIEGRVGDEVVDLPGDEEAPLAVHVGPLHAPLGHGRGRCGG